MLVFPLPVSANAIMEPKTPVIFKAADGYALNGILYPGRSGASALIVNSATAVPQEFYRRFAVHMQARGWTVLTYDYRGMGASAPPKLRGFVAHLSDWGLKDIQAAVDFVETDVQPPQIFMVGHSAGGQQAGLITGPDRIAAMVTVSAQSGYWGLQGGWEKPKVWFYATVMIPALTRIFGYLPWRWFGGEDLPYHVALEWSAWCRSPGYLRDDMSLPLHRYGDFRAPVLAYSVEDDGWGTKAAVASMMSAYPNVTFEHLSPADIDLETLGHMGFFRRGSEALWDRVHEWFLRNR